MPSPQLRVTRTRWSAPDTEAGYYAITGVGPVLLDNARDTMRHMIDWLGTERGLDSEAAYILRCRAGDLKISGGLHLDALY